MKELDFGLTSDELNELEVSAKTARVSCEGGSEGGMG